MMNYIIITGSSKGLGEAIVKQVLKRKETTLFCLARTENKELEEVANAQQLPYHFFPFDLSDVTAIPPLVKEIFSHINSSRATSIHLINNAGLLAPAKPIQRVELAEITTNIQVNLLAPMILTAEFIKQTEDIATDKRIINISSGAGKRPIYGWSCYGTSKAGIDLFSQNVAAEQKEAINPVEICSFGPGIMDTTMQEEIRSSKKDDFIHVETFKQYKENGKLLPPDKVANIVIQLLDTKDFPNGEVTDVSNYLS